MSACLFICLFTYKLHGCLWSMCMFVNLFSLPFLILVLEPEDTEEPVLREHVEAHSTARVGFWHTRTSPRTAAPILTKMKHTQTGSQEEQIYCGLPPMNSVTLWVLSILMCAEQLCILIIRDTLKTCNFILTTSTAFDLSMVLVLTVDDNAVVLCCLIFTSPSLFSWFIMSVLFLILPS